MIRFAVIGSELDQLASSSTPATETANINSRAVLFPAALRQAGEFLGKATIWSETSDLRSPHDAMAQSDAMMTAVL